MLDPSPSQSADSMQCTVANVLRYENCYPCPFCRQGQLSGLYLMDAFACNLCDRIFSANLSKQMLQLETGVGPKPKRWYWAGQHWQSERQRAAGLTHPLWGLKLCSIAMVLLPTALIGIPGYMFPPLPNAEINFPAMWATLTALSHLTMVLWLWLEFYQIPLWVMLRVRIQRWRLAWAP